MDDDIDYDDLLGENRPDILPEPSAAPLKPVPSCAEIALARRVQELEQERDALAAELARHRPAPAPDSEAGPGGPSSSRAPDPSTPTHIIPNHLLPVFSALRTHIAELTRDNSALRLLLPGSSTSLSTQSDDDPRPAVNQPAELEHVVQRVKELVRENEELGEMVLRAGRAGAEEWQKALDDSRAVIESLDSDLAIHLETIQSLRNELEDCKALAARARPTAAGSGSVGAADASRSGSGMGMGNGNGSGARTPSGPQASGRPSLPATGYGHGGQGQGQGHRGEAYGRGSQQNHDKRRERDRDSGQGHPRREEGVKVPPRGPRDDRDTKRRR